MFLHPENLHYEYKSLTTSFMCKMFKKLIRSTFMHQGMRFLNRDWFTSCAAPRNYRSDLHETIEASEQRRADAPVQRAVHVDLLSIAKKFCRTSLLSDVPAAGKEPQDQAGDTAKEAKSSGSESGESGFNDEVLGDYNHGEVPLESTPKPLSREIRHSKPSSTCCSTRLRSSRRKVTKFRSFNVAPKSFYLNRVASKHAAEGFKLRKFFQSFVDDDDMEKFLRRFRDEAQRRNVIGCVSCLLVDVIGNPQNAGHLCEVLRELYEREWITDTLVAKVLKDQLAYAEMVMRDAPIYYECVVSVVSYILQEMSAETQIRMEEECTSF